MNTPIHDFLIGFRDKNLLRCHMPGDKGRTYPLDITEIYGADSLYEANGIIAESERNTASLFGAGKTLYSTEGSTLAIKTMLALANAYGKGRRVIAHRYAHRSFLHSCLLLGLEPDWVFPKEYLSCQITPEQVLDKITPDTIAVFIQSIDYYGGECDIEPIAEACDEFDIPLLVDNAHGAYKVFTGDHPLNKGAWCTADSAHKTLPCITGGAYLHIGKKAPETFYRRAKEMMSMFGSSSPSYLILDSLDLCTAHIAEEKEKAMESMAQIEKLKSRLASDGFILRESDEMRIIIDCLAHGYTGTEMAGMLREIGLECEMADNKYIVLLFSTVSDKAFIKSVGDILEKIPGKEPLPDISFPKAIPEQVISPREAYFSPWEEICLSDAEGRICTGIECPCPPGIPLIMPGERIDKETIKMLNAAGIKNIKVKA